MKIPNILQPLLDPAQRELPSLLAQLKIGQVLQARVSARIQPGLLRLQVATTELLARSQVDIEPGTRLRLEVVKGQPLPELRILREPDRHERQQQLVRGAMARQLPPAETRQALQAIRQQASTPRQNEVVRQFTAIMQESGVPGPRPTPRQVQRAVFNSGVFHEARLSAPGAGDPADTKLRLLQLLSRMPSDALKPGIRPEPPGPGEQRGGGAPRGPGGDSLLNRLMRLVEGSVSRIQLQQAAAVPVDDGPRQVWQLDLPIHLPGESREAMLRIERDGGGDDGTATAAWAVNLAFQFDSIGSLQCRVGLAGDRVSTTFWCERPTTHEQIEHRLPVLREALEAQGLEVVHLAGVLGAPADPLISVPIPDTLLDERA